MSDTRRRVHSIVDHYINDCVTDLVREVERGALTEDAVTEGLLGYDDILEAWEARDV